jgi:tRNA pseudouridine38-40 synthase
VAAVTRLAGVLPADVLVRAVTVAPEGFDARFSALRRRYLYRLCDQPHALDPLRRRDTVLVARPGEPQLDVAAMEAAARELVGLRDFAAFCKKREGATTVRTLLDYSWRRADDGTLEGTVIADAFCHSMVRALVGSVVPVGQGRRPVDWPAQVLTAVRRDPAVAVMPPHGLSLEQVVYPPDAELAARAQQARAVRTL